MMNAFLMFENKNFLSQVAPPQNESALIQDLELNTLFTAMASGDKFLFDVAKDAILSGLNNDVDTILYRQNILKDCLKNSNTVKTIYKLVVEAIERQNEHWYGLFRKHPSAILSDSLHRLPIFMDALKKINNIEIENTHKFESKGFFQFFTMFREEFSDAYFTEIQDHLNRLNFPNGMLIGAKLGKFNKGDCYTLRKPQNEKQSWLERVLPKKSNDYTFYIHPSDESGAEALSGLKNKGINLVANALGQSCDCLLSFFNMLRTELAFYIGCINLYEQLNQIKLPSSFPHPLTSHERKHSFNELYDVCLALSMNKKIIGNDMIADNKNLVIITGANQGGKSTFLRSIGVSQLMMQCGMFVPAESFSSNICNSLFTHYQREEDVTMKSGKLDEELNRMSNIVDQITPNSMILFNESFAATNEREGSEIAKQIVNALIQKHIKVFFVTHLYDFAYDFYEKQRKNAVFLRAERGTDGKRTFKLRVAEPLQTSYGIDLYNKIFNI